MKPPVPPGPGQALTPRPRRGVQCWRQSRSAPMMTGDHRTGGLHTGRECSTRFGKLGPGTAILIGAAILIGTGILMDTGTLLGAGLRDGHGTALANAGNHSSFGKKKTFIIPNGRWCLASSAADTAVAEILPGLQDRRGRAAPRGRPRRTHPFRFHPFGMETSWLAQHIVSCI